MESSPEGLAAQMKGWFPWRRELEGFQSGEGTAHTSSQKQLRITHNNNTQRLTGYSDCNTV